MRLYEIYDGENWCREETDAKDIGSSKLSIPGLVIVQVAQELVLVVQCNTTEPLNARSSKE